MAKGLLNHVCRTGRAVCRSLRIGHLLLLPLLDVTQTRHLGKGFIRLLHGLLLHKYLAAYGSWVDAKPDRSLTLCCRSWKRKRGRRSKWVEHHVHGLLRLLAE